MNSPTFNHVSYLWDEHKAAACNGDDVALLVYRSNLLGADLRLTNFGGGNTSCKIQAEDPLTGQPTEVMWVKGSGGDLGTMRRNGLAALYVDRLRGLRHRYRGIEHEDAMVELFNHCIFDLGSKAPSIDTPLHGFLPFKHIDHLHPDAAIAIAAAKDGRRITENLFEGTVGWVPWQRPGFDLGLKLLECLEENARNGIALRGIMLGSHGLFTWGETAYASYLNTLEVIERCADYLHQHEGRTRPVFGGAKMQGPDPEKRRQQAATLAPVLRGLCSQFTRMVGHFSDDERVLQFVNAADLDRLAPMGTSCPDHFLRTKIQPLVLDLPADAALDHAPSVRAKLEPAFQAYRAMYADYYETCKRPNSPAMRDPNPVVVLWPGVGMFTFAKDKQTARVAAEFYLNAINVMRGAEAVSKYTALPRQEAFDIEYWLLEEAKLQRMPKPKPLTGRVALVTGSGGGIGKAVARKFAEEGACVVLSDLDANRLREARDEFLRDFGKDACVAVSLDVSNAASVHNALNEAVLAFGGVDLVVNNAGISISQPLPEHTEANWDCNHHAQARIRRRHPQHRFQKRRGCGSEQRRLRFSQSSPGPPHPPAGRRTRRR